jgi:hypothetical protein
MGDRAAELLGSDPTGVFEVLGSYQPRVPRPRPIPVCGTSAAAASFVDANRLARAGRLPLRSHSVSVETGRVVEVDDTGAVTGGARRQRGSPAFRHPARPTWSLARWRRLPCLGVCRGPARRQYVTRRRHRQLVPVEGAVGRVGCHDGIVIACSANVHPESPMPSSTHFGLPSRSGPTFPGRMRQSPPSRNLIRSGRVPAATYRGGLRVRKRRDLLVAHAGDGRHLRVADPGAPRSKRGVLK